MVEQSKVLNTPGAEKQTKRELFDALRQELEAPVLEKASKSVWELILDGEGLGKEISETVERVFCRLSGQEPPLFPTASTEKEKEKEKEKKGKENLKSSSKKRSFNEMKEGGEGGSKSSNVSSSDANLPNEASDSVEPSSSNKP